MHSRGGNFVVGFHWYYLIKRDNLVWCLVTHVDFHAFSVLARTYIYICVRRFCCIHTLPPPRLVVYCTWYSAVHRLGDMDLGPNLDVALRLTLNKEGETLRWFYFPFEEQQGHDVSQPRTKAPQCIISPKMYSSFSTLDDEGGSSTHSGTRTPRTPGVGTIFISFPCGYRMENLCENECVYDKTTLHTYPKGPYYSLLREGPLLLNLDYTTVFSEERC